MTKSSLEAAIASPCTHDQGCERCNLCGFDKAALPVAAEPARHTSKAELRDLKQEITRLNPLIPQNHPVWSHILNYGDARAAEAASSVPALPGSLDVRKILLGVTPGFDGMGDNVYAKNVSEVEQKLSEIGLELEDWRMGIRELPKVKRLHMIERALLAGMPSEKDGGIEPVSVAKALLAKRRMTIRRSTQSSAAFLVNIQVTGWDDSDQREARVTAFANGFNAAITYYTAALLSLLDERA